MLEQPRNLYHFGPSFLGIFVVSFFFFLLTASIYVLLSELCLILYSRPQHPFLQRKRVKRPRRKPEGAEPREKGSGSQRMSVSAVVMVDSWCYVTESSAPRPTTSPAWAWASGPLVGAQHPCSFWQLAVHFLILIQPLLIHWVLPSCIFIGRSGGKCSQSREPARAQGGSRQ